MINANKERAKTMLPRLASRSLVLAVALLGLLAAPALAAPALQVELTRDKAEFPEVSRHDERVDYTVVVSNAGADPTSGPVNLAVELPGGPETRAVFFSTPTWNCDPAPATDSDPASVSCGRSDVLAAGASYSPTLTIVTKLGDGTAEPAVAKATVFGGGSPAASDEVDFDFVDKEFGLEPGGFEAAVFDEEGNVYTQAGGHPFEGVGHFPFQTKRRLQPEGGFFQGGTSRFAPIEHVKQVFTELPRGFVGNTQAIPELCPSVEALDACPAGSRVGGVRLVLAGADTTFAIYAIEPEFGTPAQFAFPGPSGEIYTLSARVRPGDGYAVTLEVSDALVTELLTATATLCNYGAKASGTNFAGCKEFGEPGANPVPLFGNPTRCDSQPVTRARMNSWENPAVFKTFSFATAASTGCGKVDFEPSIKLDPTSDRADSPTGLDVKLTMPTEGLEGKDEEGDPDEDATSQANLKRARITFPRGMAVNASAGHGLEACSAGEVGIRPDGGRLVPDGEPAECPDGSKIGTVEIETPILDDTLSGDVFIAEQGAVGGALVGLYLVFESAQNGIIVKMPARVDLNRRNGRLVTVVDESPEAPFSSVEMHFPGGSRATLLTPPKCGRYSIRAELSPWTAKDPDRPTDDETVTKTSRFEVTEGPGGGPCPKGALEPSLSAGSANPVAGATSPFSLRLTREDGSQRFKALNLAMPRGLTAYLKGVPYCPEAVLAAISQAPGTGQAEIDDPSCPAASQVGTVVAGAGAGPDPFYVDTGRAYLAGPYKGAPLSIAVVAPAVAGPLDLGNVVVRNAVHIDPETAKVSVVSDRIPTILHGLLLDIRDVRVAIDRPGFTLNPTSCEAKSVVANVHGERNAISSLANHFQVGGCGALGFKPRLFTRLFGGTKRGDFPRFRAVLMAGEGEANISRTVVKIPRSEFVEQGHFRTICTRVQFAADACPEGSVYGHVKAFSPLVDYPLEGPVYLRSSDNELPDLVMTVKGPPHQPVEAAAVARIDSIRGQLRATIGGFPDVPVTKAIVTMQGGEKGLLVNSRDICKRRYRTFVNMRGQNGKVHKIRPVLNNTKCKRQRRAKRSRAAHRGVARASADRGHRLGG